jgi:NAD(P)-dependent dehydrogenase (short-subunit alcohol dehydrogenase family)
MIQDNGEEFLDKVAQINPLKRIALPQDISNLIKFLISEDSSYINGQVISIEGAYTNQDPTLLIEEETVLK